MGGLKQPKMRYVICEWPLTENWQIAGTTRKTLKAFSLNRQKNPKTLIERKAKKAG